MIYICKTFEQHYESLGVTEIARFIVFGEGYHCYFSKRLGRCTTQTYKTEEMIEYTIIMNKIYNAGEHLIWIIILIIDCFFSVNFLMFKTAEK